MAAQGGEMTAESKPLIAEDEESDAAQLKPGTLARFLDGLTWGRIYQLDMRRKRGWWRSAVALAEADGWLEWSREQRAWRLTDRGRWLVRSVS